MALVYSTNQDSQYSKSDPKYVHFLPAESQKLVVQLDNKQRGGKQVTLITGFIGKKIDFEQLTKTLKQTCGTGGSFKDGHIMIQGDHRTKIVAHLEKMGYSSTLK